MPLMPFDSADSFPTRSSVIMAKPTPASCLTHVLIFDSTLEECVASTNFFDLSYLFKASITQGSYFFPVSAKFSTNKRHSTLSDSALPMSLRTFHAPIFHFVFFLCVRQLKGIHAGRDLPARGGGGSRQLFRRHSVAPPPNEIGTSKAVLKWSV